MGDRSHLYVMNRPCDQCLFGSNRIVSPERAAQVLATCHEDSRHFVCHKATLVGDETVCAGFYARWPHHTPAMRLAAIYPDQLLRFVRGNP